MFKVVAFGVGRGEVEGLFRDELGDIFVFLFGICYRWFAGHDELMSRVTSKHLQIAMIDIIRNSFVARWHVGPIDP